MKILKCLSKHQNFSQISQNDLETHQKSHVLKNHQNLSEALPCKSIKKSVSHHFSNSSRTLWKTSRTPSGRTCRHARSQVISLSLKILLRHQRYFSNSPKTLWKTFRTPFGRTCRHARSQVIP